MMGWGTGYGVMGWAGWLWPILMLVFWVALIATIVWLVGGLFRRSSRPAETSGDALEILKRRYAAGQITREEFMEGRKLLQD